MATILRSYWISKEAVTRLTLIAGGIFLMLSGLPLASYSVSHFPQRTTEYPYLPLGAPLVLLGLAMLGALFISEKVSLRQAHVVIGLCGQALLGLVIFLIPLLPTPEYATRLYNLGTYSIILGSLGITLSLLSILMLSNSFSRKLDSTGQ